MTKEPTIKESKKGKERPSSMTLKNYTLQPLYIWLSVPLHSKQARARNYFVKIVSEKIKELDSSRIELLEKYSKKDKDGKAIIEKNQYQLEDEHIETYKKEFEELMDETYIIDLLDSNREYLQIVKDIILNLDRKFDIAEGATYEEVCQAFETL
jgi:hypothetical protein